jgi:acetyltransferase
MNGLQMMQSNFFEMVELRDGSKVILRPIRPDDAPRLQQTFSMLSPHTIYMRFLSTATGLSDEQARYLAEVDYQTRMAIVAAIQEAGEERIIAVARYGMLIDHPPGFAEAAIVVRDDYQRHGLGSILMERLVLYAKENGVRAFVATVHTSNLPVIKFIQKSGLRIEKKMLEPGVWEMLVFLSE